MRAPQGTYPPRQPGVSEALARYWEWREAGGVPEQRR
jgi:hypothetical protein